MQLKTRTNNPAYTTKLMPDINHLYKLLIDYNLRFTNQPLLDSKLYELEVIGIKNEWTNRSASIDGGRSQDLDLTNLFSAFKFMKEQQNLSIVLINLLFRRIYSYLPDLITDNEVGYCTDEQYNDYLSKIKEIVEKCKSVGLSNYNKPEAAQLLKVLFKQETDPIAKLFKKIASKN